MAAQIVEKNSKHSKSRWDSEYRPRGKADNGSSTDHTPQPGDGDRELLETDKQAGNEPRQKKRKTSEEQFELTAFNPTEHGLDNSFRLTKYSDIRARRSKVSMVVIDNLLKGFHDESTDPAKGSLGLSMDASICPTRHGGLAIIQTSNVFYPCIDDPYLQGRIACASVLADLYAVGVTSVDGMLMKLSISGKLTEKERDVIIPIIIKGFHDCAKQAGTRVTGGQTVLNPWCMIGGVASAVCSNTEYLVPDRACAGDVLVLTKPLGTQIAVNCYEWMKNSGSWQKNNYPISEKEILKAYTRALDCMRRLNDGAANLMHKYRAHAATAVGGFGLLGHAMTLARCQKNEVSFVIHNLPVIARMAALSKAKGAMFQLTQGLACEASGGLLICLPRDQAAAFCKDIEANHGTQAWIIGIVEKGDRSAKIIEKPRIIEVPSKDRENELW